MGRLTLPTGTPGGVVGELLLGEVRQAKILKLEATYFH